MAPFTRSDSDMLDPHPQPPPSPSPTAVPSLPRPPLLPPPPPPKPPPCGLVHDDRACARLEGREPGVVRRLDTRPCAHRDDIGELARIALVGDLVPEHGLSGREREGHAVIAHHVDSLAPAKHAPHARASRTPPASPLPLPRAPPDVPRHVPVRPERHVRAFRPHFQPKKKPSCAKEEQVADHSAAPASVSFVA